MRYEVISRGKLTNLPQEVVSLDAGKEANKRNYPYRSLKPM